MKEYEYDAVWLVHGKRAFFGTANTPPPTQAEIESARRHGGRTMHEVMSAWAKRIRQL